MGYADMLAALGLNYGDEKMTELIFKTKLKAELDASIDLSIMRGSFPLWNKDQEFLIESDGDVISGKNEWYQMLSEIYTEEAFRMIKWGRRNSGISTVAPTGSTSLIAQCSSGIEPVFMPFYKRRKRIGLGEKGNFTDENGIEYIEYVVVHPQLKTWYQTCDPACYIESLEIGHWEDLFKASPYYHNTAPEIDPIRRVSTQALIQKYITSSISSTVNLPKEATIEDVNNIYKEVFKQDCKGITCYREGSRSGVLVSTSTKRGEVHPSGVIKRPKVLEADYWRVIAGGKELIVIIGLYENKPYEVFAFRVPEDSKIPKDNHKGTITKMKKQQYSFDSKFIHIDNLELSYEMIEEKACTLYASMLLRHGADIKHIIKVTKKVDENITSFASAVCRVLSKYITAENTKEPCPNKECNGHLIHEGGCIRCDSCDYSKCS